MNRRSMLLGALFTIALPALGSSLGSFGCKGPSSQGGEESGKVRLQLKWMTQAQFAGYYAAKAKGFYTDEKLDVTILPGGPDIVPEQVVAGGGAEFGIDWLPSLLSAREQGTPLINIAQVFQHSGMRQVAFKTSGIKSAADLRGRKVAVWFGGNEFELLATLDKHGVDRNKDVTLVQQPFDMNLLLTKQVDAASAMTYNEYKQVLDSPGVKADDLVIIDFNQEGTAMLEDGIFAREDWLKDDKHKDVAARFLRASLRGWAACRDNAGECVDIVVKQSPTLGKEHQAWMMSEVNKLVWGPPSPTAEPGLMDKAAFRRTADIALKFKVLKKPAENAAFTTAVWEASKKK
ncbi:ABC transporter substrate-binding protein [Pendulispora albinea]|uniref:Thiamine pyrimidine synthase n=1 Tax=Pendulispora albinea TaxID=2741071 RepID=A0ABZ2M5Z8_9BACT